MDKDEAIKATRNGAIAACVSAVCMVIVVLLAMNMDIMSINIESELGGKLAAFHDMTILYIELPIILFCAWGIYRKSRTAAIMMFVYYLISKIMHIYEEQNIRIGYGVILVFLYLFAKAIQGAFVYHKLKKQENPDYKAATKLTYFLAIPSVLIMTALLGLSLLATFGGMPSTKVLTRQEMKSSDVNELRTNGIVDPQEKIEYFYPYGLTSILEEGVVLTQENVTYYLTNEKEEVEVYQLPIQEITHVELELEGNTFNDSIYKVGTKDPERWMKIYLSAESRGDQRFVRALRAQLSTQ